MLYQLVVLLHVISVFGFLLSHGVSASISYALKREREMPRIPRPPRSFCGFVSNYVVDFARHGCIWSHRGISPDSLVALRLDLGLVSVVDCHCCVDGNPWRGRIRRNQKSRRSAVHG